MDTEAPQQVAEEQQVPEGFNVVKEGSASILYPEGNQVFYNPVQEFNRDISILNLRLLAETLKSEGTEGFRVLEALSATGLRAVRYAKELEGLDYVVANDIDPSAVQSIERNAKYNNVPEGLIRTQNLDAKFLLHKLHHDVSGKINHPETALHAVDLDPYGGADPFLDGAVQLVADGGLLLVTCTDLAVLCGNYGETCWAKYSSMPLRNVKYCHEMALRILLATIANHCARYKRYIVPMLSVQVDFYVRVFVRVYTSPGEVKKTASKLGYVYQCSQCDSYQVQRACKHTQTGASQKFSVGTGPVVDQKCSTCGGTQHMGGAFWLDPIHDAAWLDRAIAHLDERVRNPENFKHHYGTQKRLLGILHNCRDELPDIPFYYSLPSLCNTLRTTQPRLDVMRSALYKLGFKVSPSHTDPTGIKTDAPLSVMYDILKLWQAKTVGSTKAGKNLSENSPGFKIMSQPQTSVPEDKIGTLFEVVPEAIVPTRNLPDGSKMARFQPNPTPMWGPGSRAGGKRGFESMTEMLKAKKRANQNKSHRKRAKVNETTETTPAPETDKAGDDAMDVQES